LIISDIQRKPQQQPFRDAECGDDDACDDEGDDLRDYDREGSTTGDNSESESENEEDNEELSVMAGVAQGMPETYQDDTSSGSTHNASGMCSIYSARTLLIFCILASEDNESVAINQTHFTMEAIPSRRGCLRRTRDMAELFVCICGS